MKNSLCLLAFLLLSPFFVPLASAQPAGGAERQTVSDTLSIQLRPALALPNGMTMETYVLRNFWKHSRPLRAVCPNFQAQGTYSFLQNFDYSTLPPAVRSAMKAGGVLGGFSLSQQFMAKHPQLDITLRTTLTSVGGKVTVAPPQVTRSNIDLTDDDRAGLLQLTDFFPNFYDLINDPKRGFLGRKHAQRAGWTYKGAYEEHGRTIFVLERPGARVEVVEGLWCIRSVRTFSFEQARYCEYVFEEVFPGAYLPTSFVQCMQQTPLTDHPAWVAKDWDSVRLSLTDDTFHITYSYEPGPDFLNTAIPPSRRRPR